MINKIIVSIFISFCLLFASCEDSQKYQEEDASVNTIMLNTPQYGSIKINVIKYNYDGHWYQMHYHPGGNGSVAGFVHDPNCPCHDIVTKTKNNESEFEHEY